MKSPGVGQLQAKNDLRLADRNAIGRGQQEVRSPAARTQRQRGRPFRLVAALRQGGSVGGVVRGKGPGIRGQRSGFSRRVTRREQGMGGSPPIGPAERAVRDGVAVQLPPQPDVSVTQPPALPPGRPAAFRGHRPTASRPRVVGTRRPGASGLDDRRQRPACRNANPSAGRTARADPRQPLGGGPRQQAGRRGDGRRPARSLRRPRHGAHRRGHQAQRAATHHLSIDGPGQMDITMTNDLDGRPLPAPCKLTVDWQGGMAFDGRTAHFEQSVVASTPGIPSKTGMTEFRLKTSTMDVQLQRPIRFSDSKSPERAADRGNSLQGRREDRQPLVRRSATTRFARPDGGHRSGSQPAWRRR